MKLKYIFIGIIRFVTNPIVEIIISSMFIYEFIFKHKKFENEKVRIKHLIKKELLEEIPSLKVDLLFMRKHPSFLSSAFKEFYPYYWKCYEKVHKGC